MDQPRLFEGPIDVVHIVLTRTPPVGWRLRISSRREGNLRWAGEVYEELTVQEASDVVDVHLDVIDRPLD